MPILQLAPPVGSDPNPAVRPRTSPVHHWLYIQQSSYKVNGVHVEWHLSQDMVWNRAGFLIVNASLQIRCTSSVESGILSDTLLTKDKLTETIMSVCYLYIRQTYVLPKYICKDHWKLQKCHWTNHLKWSRLNKIVIKYPHYTFTFTHNLDTFYLEELHIKFTYKSWSYGSFVYLID